MNCPICKGGPLIVDETRHEAFCPQCSRVTTPMQMAQLKQHRLASGLEKMVKLGNIFVDSTYEDPYCPRPSVMITPPQLGHTIGDIQRSTFPFWRAQHTNPEMWTDHPTPEAETKDLLMAELEKKLTGGQS